MRNIVARKLRKEVQKVNLNEIDYPPKVKSKRRWVYRQLKKEYGQKQNQQPEGM